MRIRVVTMTDPIAAEKMGWLELLHRAAPACSDIEEALDRLREDSSGPERWN